MGVDCVHVPVENYKVDVGKYAADNGYDYSDEIVISRDKLTNYEDKVKTFFDEHLHTDDEIRYIIEGEGFFDVRSKEDEWIRILSEPGDLLIIPAGIYHRFTVSKTDFIHVIRLFKGEPKWTPYNRNQEVNIMPIRSEYLKKLS